MAKKAIQWLSDEEVRVRIASGEYLGILCTVFGPSIYENYKTVVIELIREHIERAFEKSNEMGANSGRMSPRSEEILHDTAGEWLILNTN